MFDYTSMLVQETINDIKRIGNIAKYSTQGFYIAYLIYALIAGAGFWFINAPLLALAVGYLIYDLHSTNHPNKSKNKKVRRILNRIKQVIKLFPLAVSLYNLCLTLESPNIFALLTTAFTLISWLLAFVFDILTVIIEKRYNLFKEAIQADVDELLKPIKTAGNFIKKLTGKDVDTPQPTKTRAKLDEQVVEYRKTKAEKRQQSKQEKRQQAKDKLQVIANKFRSKSAERKLLQNSKKRKTTSSPQLPAPDDKEEDNE